MKAIDAALIKRPDLSRGKIIKFGCPDNWGLVQKIKCEKPSCKECWDQELKEAVGLGK